MSLSIPPLRREGDGIFGDQKGNRDLNRTFWKLVTLLYLRYKVELARNYGSVNSEAQMRVRIAWRIRVISLRWRKTASKFRTWPAA